MKTIKQAKWIYIIISILFCAAGILLVLRPATSARVICGVLGVMALIYGAIKILGYFSRDIYGLAFQFDLALGILMLALGLIMLIIPDKVISFLPFVVGIFVLIDGVFRVQTSIDARRFGLGKWWLIFLGAVLCIIAGLLLMLNPFSSAMVLTVIVGIAIFVDGLQNLFNAIYTVKFRGKDKVIYADFKEEN
jgi:uncharacterized membrane protein HdeD (DUF308 family)